MSVRRLFPLLTVSISVALALALGEVVVRAIDGYSLGAVRLARPRVAIREQDTVLLERVRGYVRDLPVAQGVERAWFAVDPPALGNRGPVPESFRRIHRAIRDSRDRMLPADVFKVYNEAMIRERACPGHGTLVRRLRNAMGFAFAYRTPDGGQHPAYRFYPGVTTPMGLVTNRFGWRGADIEPVKRQRTIRIAFLGASTTVSAHHFPFSYPEYIGHWLNLWAQSKKLDVNFEVLNTGREGIASTDIAAIVRHELLVARPDLAVYYEGSNQFSINPLVSAEDHWPSAPDFAAEESGGLKDYFALARRLGLATRRLDPAVRHEPPKPEYQLNWPAGVNERDPGLDRDDLPVSLPVILSDLDDIRSSLAGVDAELLLSSFVWLVEDGMVLDPVRDRHLYDYLNRAFWPYRYRDMRRLADFQNRVFEKYATRHEIPFLDVARHLPRDPALFSDAIHMRSEGLRLRAWLTFQLLLPIVEERIASGALPRAEDRPAGLAVPRIDIFRSELRCGQQAGSIVAGR